MCLRLRLKSTSTIPISVAGILPSRVCGLSDKEAAKLLVWHGNRKTELGELFDVSKTDSNSGRLIFEGNLVSVHWLGQHMDDGEVIVEGDVGRHVGSQMSGGHIQIAGNAGDYLGCEITGGSIRVSESTGNWTGAGYLGAKVGMNGGLIAIQKNAGHGVGSCMRRGTICVGGSTGRLAGWNMKAGTIAIGRQAGQWIGVGMVRGTVLLPSLNDAAANVSNLPPTFSAGCKVQLAILGATVNWVRESIEHMPTAENGFRQFHGDHLKGGRGEVFVAG